MEPIDSWLDDSMPTIPKAEALRHPAEDAFRHPDELSIPVAMGDELMAVPPKTPKGTPEEQLALFEFMNLATAADRLGERDMVTLPEHYARFKIEPIRFICENNLNFFQANIVKYILRWDAKNGMEDLKKARRYLDMFMKFVEKDPDWWRAP